ncbi:MAG: DUF4465 domain-containing protein [Bacteroidales bacterium]
MKKTLNNLVLLMLILVVFTACQKDNNDDDDNEVWVSDFSEMELDPESFWNGSDQSGGFVSGNLFFPNTFNEEWSSWSGFSVSNISDNETPGFINQYSAYTGESYDGNINYTVMYVSEFDETNHIKLTGENKDKSFRGMFVTNNTYAALAMRDGDDFSKKFGGEDGNDPDWFKLNITGFKDGSEIEVMETEFYLADYRFDDNTQNYIIDSWEWIDLSEFAGADELRFFLHSSDVGEWGINTPAYFCIGQVEVD